MLSTNTFLSDEEIVENMKEYIDTYIYDYAVLIDGEWGCGKTYFIKNILIERLQEWEKVKIAKGECERKVIYISLYGVKSVDEISKLLYMNILGQSNKFTKEASGKFKGFAVGGAKILTEFLGDKGISGEGVKEVFESFIDMTKYILIFDDLERCNCDVNQVLGYINNFVEQDKIKVILIANEKEIGKNERFNNVEQKYLLVKNNDINFENDDVSKSHYYPMKDNDNIDSNKSISINHLKNRASLLFDENSIYKQIKEKLIGVTIRYVPNVISITEKLIYTHITDESLKAVLLKLQDENIRYAVDKEHMNLRTFQFFLSKVQRLNQVIKEVECDRDEVIESITRYCFKICVLYKFGNYKNLWDRNVEYDNIPLEGMWNIKEYTLGFRFVDEYILASKLNKEEIKRVIENYFGEIEARAVEPNNPLVNINGWWELEESEVRKIIDELLTYIVEDKYRISTFPKILQRILNILKCGIESEILEKIVDAMKSKIVGKKVTTELYIDYSGLSSQDSEEKYNRIMRELNEIIRKQLKEDKDINMESILNDSENWGYKLYEYISELKSESTLCKSFIEEINVDRVLMLIEKSNSRNICGFRYTIDKLYNFSNINEYYSSDSTKLNELIEGIGKYNMEEFDLIKKMNIRILDKILKEIYEKLVSK